MKILTVPWFPSDPVTLNKSLTLAGLSEPKEGRELTEILESRIQKSRSTYTQRINTQVRLVLPSALQL